MTLRDQGKTNDMAGWLRFSESQAARIAVLESALREMLASCGPFVPSDNVPGDQAMWTGRYLTAVERVRGILSSQSETK